MLDTKMLAALLPLLSVTAAEPQWPFGFGGNQAAKGGNPFQQSNPFGQIQPQQQPQPQPQAQQQPYWAGSNPFAAGQGQPRGQPKQGGQSNPFAAGLSPFQTVPNAKPAAQANPFGASNPFSNAPPAQAQPQPAAYNPFGQPQAQPQPAAYNPFAQPQPQPAANNPFAQPQPQPAANNPFAQPQPFQQPQPTGIINNNPFGAPGKPAGGQPKPPAQGLSPTPTKPKNDDSMWTPPAEWGPKGGRQPFGPKAPGGPPAGPLITPGPVSPAEGGPGGGLLPAITTRPDYCTNKDLICTTIVEPPREPLPYKVTCGRTLYIEDDVSNALKVGCNYVRLNKKIGATDFPREFNNVGNRFDFGPYIRGRLWEMPLIDSAAFAGGPPGVDRVIFSMPDCFLAGELTIASGQYSECTEEY